MKNIPTAAEVILLNFIFVLSLLVVIWLCLSGCFCLVVVLLSPLCNRMKMNRSIRKSVPKFLVCQTLRQAKNSTAKLPYLSLSSWQQVLLGSIRIHGGIHIFDHRRILRESKRSVLLAKILSIVPNVGSYLRLSHYRKYNNYEYSCCGTVQCCKVVSKETELSELWLSAGNWSIISSKWLQYCVHSTVSWPRLLVEENNCLFTSPFENHEKLWTSARLSEMEVPIAVSYIRNIHTQNDVLGTVQTTVTVIM